MLIACIISFIIGALIMTCVMGVVSNCKIEEPHNNVHFYVTRDTDCTLTLWLRKPCKNKYYWINTGFTVVMAVNKELDLYGLNIEDYDSLKWEDEPVEVFLNLED